MSWKCQGILNGPNVATLKVLSAGDGISFSAVHGTLKQIELHLKLNFCLWL